MPTTWASATGTAGLRVVLNPARASAPRRCRARHARAALPNVDTRARRRRGTGCGIRTCGRRRSWSWLGRRGGRGGRGRFRNRSGGCRWRRRLRGCCRWRRRRCGWRRRWRGGGGRARSGSRRARSGGRRARSGGRRARSGGRRRRRCRHCCRHWRCCRGRRCRGRRCRGSRSRRRLRGDLPSPTLHDAVANLLFDRLFATLSSQLPLYTVNRLRRDSAHMVFHICHADGLKQGNQ